MSDYAQMTDAEINRAVAMRLGWAVVPDGTRPDMFDVVSPDGGLYAWTGTPDTIWRDLFGAVCEINLPGYATDANAALEVIGDLLHTTDVYFALTMASKAWRCRIVDGDDLDTADVWKADAATPARAICEAWLAYRDAEEQDE